MISKLCYVPMLSTFPVLIVGIPIVPIFKWFASRNSLLLNKTDTILQKYELWASLMDIKPYKPTMLNLLQDLSFWRSIKRYYENKLSKVNSLSKLWSSIYSKYTNLLELLAFSRRYSEFLYFSTIFECF